jgi:hypothetical protein
MVDILDTGFDHLVRVRHWFFCALIACQTIGLVLLMNFTLTEEQQMIVKTTRDFVVNELYPHEKEVEETGKLRQAPCGKLKAIAAMLFATEHD